MIDIDVVIDAVESGEYVGFCVKCGEEASGVEPDARKYECESCGERGVYGAEELLIMYA
jgi:DNA-directed RNA polymerase subunit RPC12/RpoP